MHCSAVDLILPFVTSPSSLHPGQSYATPPLGDQSPGQKINHLQQKHRLVTLSLSLSLSQSLEFCIKRHFMGARYTWGWIYRTWSIFNLLAGFFFLFRIDISLSYCYIVVLFLRLMKVILRYWMFFVVSRCIFLSLNIRGVRLAFKRGFPFKSFPEKSLREKIIISR